MEAGERKNVTQPPDWWAAFQAAAEKAGVSLSEWMGDTCRAALPRKIDATLSERRGRGQPRKPTPEATSSNSTKSV